MSDDLETWPVLPEGVEAVLQFRMPEDWVPPPTDCFVCAEPMPDASESQPCVGVPERGVAHAACYDRWHEQGEG